METSLNQNPRMAILTKDKKKCKQSKRLTKRILITAANGSRTFCLLTDPIAAIKAL